MKVIQLSIILIFSYFLSGCSVTPESFLANKRKHLIEQGHNMNFIDGYLDGCSSGKEALGNKNYNMRKDNVRYKKQKNYGLGWERGYYICRDEDIIKLQHNVQQKYIPSKNKTEEKERAKIWRELKK